MSAVPADLQYTENHVWMRALAADGTLEVGITDHAQQTLGDLLSVTLPETGRNLKQGEAFAVVESVKTMSDVYSPVAGEVTASNLKLDEGTLRPSTPDAYRHWLVRARPAPGPWPRRSSSPHPNTRN